MPLSQIGQAEIDKAAYTLYPEASPSTRNRHVYTPCSSIMKHAAARGLCDERKLQRPKQPDGRIRYLSIDDADALIDAAAPHLKPVLVFLFYTGARLSEALHLDW
jgi:integrase